MKKIKLLPYLFLIVFFTNCEKEDVFNEAKIVVKTKISTGKLSFNTVVQKFTISRNQKQFTKQRCFFE